MKLSVRLRCLDRIVQPSSLSCHFLLQSKALRPHRRSAPHFQFMQHLRYFSHRTNNNVYLWAQVSNGQAHFKAAPSQWLYSHLRCLSKGNTYLLVEAVQQAQRKELHPDVLAVCPTATGTTNKTLNASCAHSRHSSRFDATVPLRGKGGLISLKRPLCQYTGSSEKVQSQRCEAPRVPSCSSNNHDP